MENFIEQLHEITEDSVFLDFCRKNVLHGIPFLFKNREDEYYEFQKKIANNFNVSFHEIYITGSAKLGFSPRKKTNFSLDSDVDIAIVSPKLFDEIMESIRFYQMSLRENRLAVSEKEIQNYHKFLEYGAIGWMRPDLLPISFQIEEIKIKWFDFFKSISHGRSEAGNYKVAAGVFKSYWHLESYIYSGLKSLQLLKNVKGS